MQSPYSIRFEEVADTLFEFIGSAERGVWFVDQDGGDARFRTLSQLTPEPAQYVGALYVRHYGLSFKVFIERCCADFEWFQLVGIPHGFGKVYLVVDLRHPHPMEFSSRLYGI